MDSKKLRKQNANNFSPGVVQGLRARFLKRFERRIECMEHGATVTWSYALIRNKAKIIERVRNTIRGHRRSGPWNYALAGQKEKLWRLLDPYRRWMKCEAGILEKMNRGEFRQEAVYVMGFAWTYCMNLQSEKVRLRLIPGMAQERSKLRGWPAAIQRGQNRVLDPLKEPIQIRTAWEVVIYGTLRKFHWKLGADHDWNGCILRARRRGEHCGLE